MSKMKPYKSFFKMPNTTAILKILKRSGTEVIRNGNTVSVLDKDTFSVMRNLQFLNLNLFKRNYKFVIRNGCFNNLFQLRSLNLGLCDFFDSDNCSYFSDLKNLEILELTLSKKLTNPNIFVGLSNLIELNFSYNAEFDLENISFEPLIKLQILFITLNNVKSNFFKGLSNLKHLYIKSNIYNGQLKQFRQPSLKFIEREAFNGLEKLLKLDLSGNQLDRLESCIFENLSNLKELNLADSNQLKIIDNDAFKGLFSLEKLDLNGINFDLLNQSIFTYLISLKTLNLETFYRNSAKNPFRCLANLNSVQSNINFIKELSCKQMERVQVESGDFHNAIKEINNFSCELKNFKLKLAVDKKSPNVDCDLLYQNSLQGLEMIKHLTINSSRGLEIESTTFKHLIHMESFDLTSKYLEIKEGNLHSLFQKNNNIEFISISLCDFFDIDSNFFENLENLKQLKMSWFIIETLKDKLFIYLKYLELLKITDIRYGIEMKLNEFTFYGLTKLKILNLEWNSIKSLNKNTFCHLINLVHLNLRQCNIKFVDLLAFTGLLKLEKLNLSNNNIEDMNSEHFKGLIRLKQLNLYKNPFIYKPNCIQFYKNLNIIDLDLIID